MKFVKMFVALSMALVFCAASALAESTLAPTVAPAATGSSLPATAAKPQTPSPEAVHTQETRPQTTASVSPAGDGAPAKDETPVLSAAPAASIAPAETTACIESEAIAGETPPQESPEPPVTHAPENTDQEPVGAATENPASATPMPEATPGQEEVPQTVTVRFLDWNDEVLDAFELTVGDAVREPENEPSRGGWTFLHWYPADGDASEPFRFGGAVGNSLDLKACYVKNQEDGGLIEIEDEQVPLAGAQPKAEIFSSVEDGEASGKTVRLTSRLTGFDGLVYGLQWQYNDGSGWTDVPGANGQEYAFTVNADNAGWQWRLCAYIQ